jgi:hypothetical protein
VADNYDDYADLPHALRPAVREYLKGKGSRRYVSHFRIGRVVGSADDLYIELALILTPVPGVNHEQD